MDISAKINTDVNPIDNLGKLLQMMSGAGSDYSEVKEKKADTAGDVAENDNNFLQVMQTKLNELMKSDKSENAQWSTLKEDLFSGALEKLLQEDQTVTGELLSGLALLAIDGQTGNLLENEKNLSGTSFSKLMGATGQTSILQEEISTFTDQTKATLLKVPPDNLTGFVVEENSDTKNAKPQAFESSFTKPHENLNVCAEEQSMVDGMQEKVIAELKTSDGGMEKKSQSPTSLLSDNQNNPLNQTGEEFKKIMSGKPDSPNAEGQPSPTIMDAKINMAGKVTASPDEQVAMANKIKPELKGKTVYNEINLESRSLNTSSASGMSQAKTSGDVSATQIIDRVAVEFREILSNEGGRVKITLAPPSLGTLEMDVIVRNGTVKVMLIADNKDVQQMLSGNLDTLKGSLQSQGLTIVRCDVMMQDRQYSQGFNQQAFNQEQSTKEHNAHGEPYSQNAQTVTPMISKTGNLSTWYSGNISIFA